MTRSMRPLTSLRVAGWASGCGGARMAPGASRASTSAQPASYESHAEADSAAPAEEGGAYEGEAPAPDRPGLGTEFGESVRSSVTSTPFVRAGTEPFASVALHYNDADGIEAQARYRGAGLAPISAHTPYGGISMAVVGEGGDVLPGFAAEGRTYVVGHAGERYLIRITNDTGGRFEVVGSVDGLDVIDGRAAAYGKRGYIVHPYSSLTIDGFRTSDDTVAAFRFAAVRDSYAARTGDDRNVGVIGLAFFAEEGSRWTTDELARRESADPFPARYSIPPP
jgi:hypothetical protein